MKRAVLSRPRWVLIGDGQSPHLVKWAHALQQSGRVELYAASTQGFDERLRALVPEDRRLALGRTTRQQGGNVGVLATLPALTRWLAKVDASVLHAHYLTSHGTLAWLARRLAGLKGDLVASAWGSDILVAPERSRAVRALTGQVLRSALLCTSDSEHMANLMRRFGASEVMTFPFGLQELPTPTDEPKEPGLVYANRALEPLYRPQRVLHWFAAFATSRPDAHLVIANDGSMRTEIQAQVAAMGLAERVQFVGRLSAAEQTTWYRRAQWFVSLPSSDSVAVSVLEAMAHGCIPVLSDLPANRELADAGHAADVVHSGGGAWVLGDGELPSPASIAVWLSRSEALARRNRDWIARNGLFQPAVARFLDRVRQLQRHAA